MDFNHILNWQLLAGSHEFPGPEGGTCINEAAIVASGFEYRSVRNSHDCPPCFSSLFSEFALSLNDGMYNDQRQKLLMPFVTRLAGSADTEEVEFFRARYMTEQVEERIYKPYIGEDQDNTYPTYDAWRRALDAMKSANWYCGSSDKFYDYIGPRSIGKELGSVVNHICVLIIINTDSISLFEKIYAIATDILSEAMEIGNKAEDPDLILVAERFEAIKAQSLISV